MRCRDIPHQTPIFSEWRGLHVPLSDFHLPKFLTQRTYSCSNFVAISSLVLELLKKCRVRYRVGHPVLFIIVCVFVCFRRDSPQWARAYPFTRFLDHTQRRTTDGRTTLDEWSARRRDLYLTTHNTHNRQTSMHPVGLEPTISACERPQTHALWYYVKWYDISCDVIYDVIWFIIYDVIW